MLLPLFVGPVGVHVIARRRMVEAGEPVPDRDTVIETLTDAFCAAVGR